VINHSQMLCPALFYDRMTEELVLSGTEFRL